MVHPSKSKHSPNLVVLYELRTLMAFNFQWYTQNIYDQSFLVAIEFMSPIPLELVQCPS